MSAPDPRQVEYLPLSSLQADPRNPKAHDQDTIDASIGRFGVLDLIVRDERTGYLISGHGRRKALTGMEKRGEGVPEGIKVDPETGEWLVPVVTGWASRTDTEAGAALIALNRTTELGGWVDEALLELLDDLAEVDDGFEGVGFGDGDIDRLRDSLDAVTAVPEESWEEAFDKVPTSAQEQDTFTRTFSLSADDAALVDAAIAHAAEGLENAGTGRNGKALATLARTYMDQVG